MTRLLLAPALGLAIGLAGVGVAPDLVLAQEVQNGRGGEIIILRKVPRRIAYKTGHPAPPLTVSTNPGVDVSQTGSISGQVVESLPSSSIISDSEAAGIAVDAPVFPALSDLGGRGRRVTASGPRSLSGNLPNRSADLGVQNALRGFGSGIASATGGVGRSVTRATSGLGGRITRALATR